MQGRAQTGLVTLVNIEDYERILLKSHELVLDSKAEDRRKTYRYFKRANRACFFVL